MDIELNLCGVAHITKFIILLI